MSAPSAQSDLERRAVSAAQGRDSEAARRTVRRHLDDYLRRRRGPLGHLTVQVDGQTASSLVSALMDPEHPLDRTVVDVGKAPPPGPRWDYLLPFRRFRFLPDGACEVELAQETPSPAPKRAIARLIVRDRFTPESAEGSAPGADGGAVPTELLPLGEFARALRSSHVVPFSIVLLLYFADRRVRVELDLADDGLEPDLRSGRLGLDRFVPRSPRISHGVDAFIARGRLSVSAARLLEVLVETHGLTAAEAAATLGGIHEMSNSALEALRARRLASFDSAHGVYRARLDAFLAPGLSGPALTEPLPPMATPALRTSVTELLAAADSRATCPLCGEVLPPGPHGILCAKCAAEVSGSNTG